MTTNITTSFDELSLELLGEVIVPHDNEYNSARSVYNAMIEWHESGPSRPRRDW